MLRLLASMDCVSEAEQHEIDAPAWAPNRLSCCEEEIEGPTLHITVGSHVSH